MTDRTQLERARDRALDDLIALRSQVAAGELDETAARRLQTRYEKEAADALAALDATPPAEPAGRSQRRVVVGIAAFVTVAAIAITGLVAAVQPRPDDLAAGPSGTVDLSTVSNEEMEAVVAANPDVVPMRLALARRYLEGGDFSSALPHYLYILERESNPEALMYLGWMTYLSGDAATGARLVEESLAVAPGDPLASWFLANIRFTGLGDAAGAVPLLRTVLASGEAPPDIIAEAERMIAEAGG